MCPRTAALLRTSLMRHGMTGNLSIARQKAHRLNKGAVLVISSLYRVKIIHDEGKRAQTGQFPPTAFPNNHSPLVLQLKIPSSFAGHFDFQCTFAKYFFIIALGALELRLFFSCKQTLCLFGASGKFLYWTEEPRGTTSAGLMHGQCIIRMCRNALGIRFKLNAEQKKINKTFPGRIDHVC